MMTFELNVDLTNNTDGRKNWGELKNTVPDGVTAEYDEDSHILRFSMEYDPEHVESSFEAIGSYVRYLEIKEMTWSRD